MRYFVIIIMNLISNELSKNLYYALFSDIMICIFLHNAYIISIYHCHKLCGIVCYSSISKYNSLNGMQYLGCRN